MAFSSHPFSSRQYMRFRLCGNDVVVKREKIDRRRDACATITAGLVTFFWSIEVEGTKRVITEAMSKVSMG